MVAIVRLLALPQTATFDLFENGAENVSQLKVVGGKLVEEILLCILLVLGLLFRLLFRRQWDVFFGSVGATRPNAACEKSTRLGGQPGSRNGWWRWR